MARNRFVNINPTTRETVKVELSDGDWVLFKRQLSNAEARRVSVAAFGNLKGTLNAQTSNEIAIDWGAMEEERVFTWLHGWSFVDANGNPVQLNRQNVQNLDTGTFDEIKQLLDKYLGKEKNDEPEPQTRLKSIGSGTTTEQ